MNQIKNCYNCTSLEWMEAEQYDNNGHMCHTREYRTDTEEENHNAQMESEKYLKAAKKCCKLKEIENDR